MVACSAFKCKNKTETGFRLFKFPADEVRRQKWVENIARENWTPVNGSRVCEVSVLSHYQKKKKKNNLGLSTFFNILHRYTSKIVSGRSGELMVGKS